MIVLAAAVGLLAGSALNWLALYLPRFAATPPTVPIPGPGTFSVASWQLLMRGSRAWLDEACRVRAAVEITAGGLFAWLWFRFGMWGWPLAGAALFTCYFLLIAVIDCRFRLVLNVMLVPAGVVGVAFALAAPWPALPGSLAGAALGIALFLAAAIMRPGGMGSGDIKLAGLIGLLFGFPYAIFPLAVGVLAGGVGACSVLVARRGSLATRMPYAPYLCVGAILGLLFNPFSPAMQPLVLMILAP